jgi:hypothetical protein
MPDFQEGKIYMIWSPAGPLRYYGSTCLSLARRMATHRYGHRNGICISSSKVFEAYGIELCKIELVENYPCASKEELNAREGFYIRNNECINRLLPDTIRTKEYIIEYSKNYYESRKEELKEYSKKYRAKKKALIAT